MEDFLKDIGFGAHLWFLESGQHVAVEFGGVLAELGCKIGDAKGKAYYVSSRQVKCVVEEIPLLAEDEDPLPAQVSLNSYSYTEPTDDTYYRPYGILQL